MRMKMKSIFVSAFILVGLSACARPGQFSVTGEGAADNIYSYVVDLATGDTVASAKARPGRVKVRGQADPNALLAFKEHGDGSARALFFNDGTPVSVNLFNYRLLKGSGTNMKLDEYDHQVSQAYDDALSAYLALDEMSEAERVVKSVEAQSKLEDLEALLQRVVKENSDNLIPAAFLSQMYNVMDEEDFAGVMDPSYVFTSHPMAERYVKRVEQAQAKQAFIGRQFSDLEEPDVNGVMHALSEYVGKGRWVLVDFWASWCGPCKAEMPNVVAAYKKYHAKGFDIVGLSFDNDKDAWVKAIPEWEMPWYHLSDVQGWQSLAAKVYGVNSIPDNLLIDPSGKIVARGLRGEALEAALAEAIKK